MRLFDFICVDYFDCLKTNQNCNHQLFLINHSYINYQIVYKQITCIYQLVFWNDQLPCYRILDLLSSNIVRNFIVLFYFWSTICPSMTPFLTLWTMRSSPLLFRESLDPNEIVVISRFTICCRFFTSCNTLLIFWECQEDIKDRSIGLSWYNTWVFFK